MKMSIATSALLIGFSSLFSTVMAANDSGRITFRGEIVNGDAPCLIGHTHHDQAVALSSDNASSFSLKVNRCAKETLRSIAASFVTQDNAALIIKHIDGKPINAAPRAILLSQNQTLDFTVNASSSSSISQLTLAYE